MRDLLNLLDEMLTETEESTSQPRYADGRQTRELALQLRQAMPDIRFEPEKKANTVYVRVFGADRQTVESYFKRAGYTELQPTLQQTSASSKYRNNILSYDINGILYTIVIASLGGANTGAIAVSIKEFTPAGLGLTGQLYNKKSLVSSVRSSVEQRTGRQPILRDILLQLIEVADGSRNKLDPELNTQLDSRSRAQLSVDFGEVLAPIKLATDSDKIEFPEAGNHPLVDVVIGSNHYSIKSLTGSGTSFSSIADLIDSYDQSVGSDKSKQELLSLFKDFHPGTGGKNTDKIIRAAANARIPEYLQAVQQLGEFKDYKSLMSAVQGLVDANSRNPMDYGEFLRTVYPIMTAGEWGKPVGLPADGKYYMNPNSGLTKPVEKSAGYPSYQANPVRAATDILTYVLGVGLLNTVTKGRNADAYSDMITNIVNQSQAWLGQLDITTDGQLNVMAQPFSKLKFKFQYHAPSHKPGNNLPGFMILY
jgi:hypothetical protein